MHKLAIIGLGYVGLPLAVAFSKKYSVIGFDINQQRVDELNQGIDNTLEVDEKELKSVLQNFSNNTTNYLLLTTDYPLLFYNLQV